MVKEEKTIPLETKTEVATVKPKETFGMSNGKIFVASFLRGAGQQLGMITVTVATLAVLTTVKYIVSPKKP